jgi:hypothetical protein
MTMAILYRAADLVMDTGFNHFRLTTYSNAKTKSPIPNPHSGVPFCGLCEYGKPKGNR